MTERGPVAGGIVEAAESRVEEHLQEKIRRGERIVSLTELTEETAIDPGTAEAVMDELADRFPARCRRLSNAEIQWYITQ